MVNFVSQASKWSHLKVLGVENLHMTRTCLCLKEESSVSALLRCEQKALRAGWNQLEFQVLANSCPINHQGFFHGDHCSGAVISVQGPCLVILGTVLLFFPVLIHLRRP